MSKSKSMLFAFVCGTLGTWVFCASHGAGQEKESDKNAKRFAGCARACAKCVERCEENFTYCGALVVAAKIEYASSARLSLDYAEICNAAAKLCARQSPLALGACEACVKACDVCATECERHKDEHVRACAAACRECAKTCREFVKAMAPVKVAN